MSPLEIRSATSADAAGVLDIYRPIVEETTISFELVTPSVEEIAARIRASVDTHAWLVATEQERVAGYAYATPHRAREAYRHSVETSVYLAADYRGRGLGSRLYEALFAKLEGLDYFNAYAGITMPNSASVALHRSVGFESIGTFRAVGFKFDAWHDVSWWQRRIRTPA